MISKLYKAVLVLLVCTAFTAAAWAQSSNSSIQGTVEDIHGAVVPGATVDLTNVGTNQHLHATSNGNGFFTFTNLSPADYKVTVNRQGFAEWEGKLTLRVSQAAQVNPTLAAAAVSTHVTVRNVTPIIDRVNPTLSDVKNAATIESMPVEDRNVQDVLIFSPGVVANTLSGGGYTRVNGIPSGSVNFLTDGQTVINQFTGNLQNTPQSTMTLQEVKITTSNGDAQFGRPGVVEMVTKSGTNHFHGQIFELNRNQHLQARQFHSGPVVPFLQHNEYGFQVGGPVWIPKVYNGKNKTFFFFDMEWLKQQRNAIVQYIVPTEAQRSGDLSDVRDGDGNLVTLYDPNSTTFDPVTGAYVRTEFPGNIIPTDRLNPVAGKILGVIPVAGLTPYPLPNIANQPYWSGVPNLQPSSSKATQDEKQITAKVDQLFGASRLAARYNYSKQNNLTPEGYGPTAPDVDLNGGHNGSLSLTTVLSPNTVNVAHIGVQYNHAFHGPIPIANIPEKLGLPTYADTVSWMGFAWSYGGTDTYWTGIDRDNPQDSPSQIISASDRFSWNHGNHQLMFGFQVNNFRLNTFETGQPGGDYNTNGHFTALQDPDQAANGVYGIPVNDTGSALADFLLGDSSGVIHTFYPHYHTRQTEYDGFAQDDWRVTRNLTLNLGLRYEYWTPFADASGLFSSFDPDVPGGMVVYAGKGPLPAQTSQEVFDSFVAAGLPIESAAEAGYPLSLFTMPKNNWEPRIGFAYQINDKTVLRGGWGVYQWILPLKEFQRDTRQNVPFSYMSRLAPGYVDGVGTNANAAELEFPIASADLGGPQPINQFMLGSQNCTNVPAGTCNPPGLLLDISNVHISQGGGFEMDSLNPHVKPQTVQEYNLTIGRELPWNTGVQISYVGNSYTNGALGEPLNAQIPRDNCAAAGSPDVAKCQAGQARYRRPYEVFSGAGITDWDGYGNTNALQAQVTHTFGGGLLVQAYFTWRRGLTVGGVEAAALTPGFSLANPTTSGWPRAQRKAVGYTDQGDLPTKEFKFNANYTLPFGRGKRFLGNAHGIVNALVSGYNIAPFFLWHSGFYFGPYASLGPSHQAPGRRGVNLAPGKTGVLPKSQRNAEHWFDASIWDPLATSGPTSGPYNGQTYIYTLTSQQGDFRNNIPLNYMTGPGFNGMNLGLYKVTPIWRNLKLDFTAQIFNVYNHVSWSLPNNKGVITKAVSTPRTIQLQAKIVF